MGRLAPRTWSLLAMVVSLLATAGVSWAVPTVEVEESAITVGGVTPGSRVALTGLFRRVNGTIPGFERRDAVLEDADGDGRVEQSLGRSIDPRWSVWIAVDLTTGEWAVGGRPEEGQSALLAGGEAVSPGAAMWSVPAGIVETLVARPGEGAASGAWGGASWDGGPADGDGIHDGAAGVVVAELVPVADSGPAPAELAVGDVLIAIEPRALGYVVTRVGEVGEGVTK